MIDLHLGDCRAILPTLHESSIDAIICDPPYPEISRPYGRLTEAEWHELMHAVVPECRRILKPTGSAVFILQPNYERIGKTRLWLWEFMVWAGREWNLVQEAYWWNFTTIPGAGAEQINGLMRRSVKYCIWLGLPDCYRNQDDVLWEVSQSVLAHRHLKRAFRHNSPSGCGSNHAKASQLSLKRGGVTPFNLIPLQNSDRWTGGGVDGHPASTPEPLCDWWIRYLTPLGGTACDPFMGSGTVGLAALKRGRSFIGIEDHPPYFEMAERRLAAARAATPMFAP